MASRVSATPIFWVGLDVHKDSVTAAVIRDRDPEPLRVDRLPHDHKRIRRYFQRLRDSGNHRVCYEASGAGTLADDDRMVLAEPSPPQAAPPRVPRAFRDPTCLSDSEL